GADAPLLEVNERCAGGERGRGDEEGAAHRLVILAIGHGHADQDPVKRRLGRVQNRFWEAIGRERRARWRWFRRWVFRTRRIVPALRRSAFLQDLARVRNFS